jgi:hypothetical protein
MKTLITVLMLLIFPALAAAQSEGQKPKPKPAAEKPKPEAQAEGKIDEPKSDEPVLEITRVGRAGCEIKPVMTDDEVEACRRAAYERK